MQNKQLTYTISTIIVGVIIIAGIVFLSLNKSPDKKVELNNLNDEFTKLDTNLQDLNKIKFENFEFDKLNSEIKNSKTTLDKIQVSIDNLNKSKDKNSDTDRIVTDSKKFVDDYKSKIAVYEKVNSIYTEGYKSVIDTNVDSPDKFVEILNLKIEKINNIENELKAMNQSDNLVQATVEWNTDTLNYLNTYKQALQLAISDPGKQALFQSSYTVIVTQYLDDMKKFFDNEKILRDNMVKDYSARVKNIKDEIK